MPTTPDTDLRLLMLAAPAVPRGLLEQVAADPGPDGRLAAAALAHPHVPADLVRPLLAAAQAPDARPCDVHRALAHAARHLHAHGTGPGDVADLVLSFEAKHPSPADRGAHLGVVVTELGPDHPVVAQVAAAASWDALGTLAEAGFHPALVAVRQAAARHGADPTARARAWRVCATASHALSPADWRRPDPVAVAQDLPGDLLVALAASSDGTRALASLIATRAVRDLAAGHLSVHSARTLAARLELAASRWTAADARVVVDATAAVTPTGPRGRVAADAARLARQRLTALDRMADLGLPDTADLSMTYLSLFADDAARAAAGRALVAAVGSDAWAAVWAMAGTVEFDTDLDAVAAMVTAVTT
jgi:hypothetical protein